MRRAWQTAAFQASSVARACCTRARTRGGTVGVGDIRDSSIVWFLVSGFWLVGRAEPGTRNQEPQTTGGHPPRSHPTRNHEPRTTNHSLGSLALFAAAPALTVRMTPPASPLVALPLH